MKKALFILLLIAVFFGATIATHSTAVATDKVDAASLAEWLKKKKKG